MTSSPTPRILVDESLPVELADELGLPSVRTVRGMGWAGLKNGELVKRAVLAGFTHLLTADQNLEFQQNLRSSELSFIVLRCCRPYLQGFPSPCENRSPCPRTVPAFRLMSSGRC